MRLTLVFASRFMIAAAICSLTTFAQAQQRVRVEITNENVPSNGVAITPVWVGFHDGSFDSYNGGLASQPGLESLAEDGNTIPISGDFTNGLTYIDDAGASNTVASSQAGAERVDGTLPFFGTGGPRPILPGESVSSDFTIATDGSNSYFSYASMILPTNDFFVANGNPLAHILDSLFDGDGTVEFQIGLPGTVNDAGTEFEDFDFSAANGLFPNRGLGTGQGGPNTGTPSADGVVTNVSGDPFANFLNAGGTDLNGFNFNDGNLYSNGIATVRITAIPEPSPAALAVIGLAGMGLSRRRR